MKGFEKTSLKTMCKVLKLKPKYLKERLAQLEKTLYKKLKSCDLDELILEALHEMSFFEEVKNAAE